jgi:hypothetical protein
MAGSDFSGEKHPKQNSKQTALERDEEKCARFSAWHSRSNFLK